MQTTVTIATPVLDWILHTVDLDVLPPQIANYLMKWKTGEKQPTFNQIDKVSRSTGVPLGYFFLQTPPEEEHHILEYRTVDSHILSKPSRELVDTIHDMEQVQDWAHNYQIATGESKVNFIGTITINDKIDEAADRIRSLLSLRKEWITSCESTGDAIRFLRNEISSIGVLVMMNGIVGNNTHRPLDIMEFRAFAIVDDYAPLIFLNANDSYNGRLFSLVHEFVHICLGQDDFFNDRSNTAIRVSPVETFCNAVAAEIIIPKTLFIQEWKKLSVQYPKQNVIDIIAHDFRCGTTVVARCALENSFINKEQYKAIAENAIKVYNMQRQRDKEEGKGGGDYYRTAYSRLDSHFLAKLSDSVASGKTLYSDAFRLTNTNRSTYFKLAESQMGGDGF